MKAIIVGGGIGGLTTALCLTKLGWQVELLEKATAHGAVGAGLQVSPNAMKVYQALGIDVQLQESGFQPEAIELRMGMSGFPLVRAPLGNLAIARWGAPYLHIHRADLLSVLVTSLEARVPGALTFGAPVTNYHQSEKGAEVTLADGRKMLGDVVIGADGIHSSIRTQMLGTDKPRFTGNVAWRAVVPVERLGGNVPNPVAGAWMGRGKHAVTYLLRRGELANLVAVVEREDWTEESWSTQGSYEEAMRDFSGWHPTITRLIKEAETLYRWALFDRPPLETWIDGRVALLGDAAHPMLPFMAQGAAMAIEDAWAIASTLNKAQTVQEALKNYQMLRYERASAIQAASSANASLFHQRSFVGRLTTYGPMWLAGRIAPKLALRRQDSVYAYDIVTKTEAL